MADAQQWGRKESLIWPPRGYMYVLAAFGATLLFTGFYVWLRYQYALSPLEAYYLPYYLRSESIGPLHLVSTYQLILITDGERHTRPALDDDVQQPGETQQPQSKPLPFVLSDKAQKAGFRLLYRDAPRRYRNPALHAWLVRWVYHDRPVQQFFVGPILWGIPLFLVLLALGLPKDIRRLKNLRYGRRLKGPVLVDTNGFNEAIKGDGIGITANESPDKLQLPGRAENKHFLFMGDTGTGKSSLIRQMLIEIAQRSESAIVYDPACEYITQFYSPDRGDVVLNPLDERMPFWSPSLELRRRVEAKAIAESMYQPQGVTNKFFVDAPRKIFAHLLTFLPEPADLVYWMSHEEEIDKRTRGTEYWSLINRCAPHQREGVLGSLNMWADSFRLLPNEDESTSVWTATKWSETRQGWVFITTRSTLRAALRPLISLWIDLLVLRLLNEPDPGQKRVWFVIDELASLQRLPQLHTAITENRKCRNPVILGLQGRSQMEARYGDDAEAMLSQPATKIFLRTGEPHAAKWVSEAIGEIEIERLRETHYEGSRAGKNFALDRQTEPLVLPSEISGLPDLRAFLKYGNHVARFSFPFIELTETQAAFVERKMDDLIVPSPLVETDAENGIGQEFVPDKPGAAMEIQLG